MKQLKIAALTGVVLFFTSFSKLAAQSEQEQRIRSSYMLALGRDANSGEVTYWAGQGNLSVSQLIERHRQYFVANAGPHRDLIVRSYVAAFGRNPSEGEIKYYINGNLTYTDLVKGHIGYLVRSNTENENTIRRAYQYALNRKPTQGEISFGVASGGLTYLFWVGWLQDPAHGKNTITVTNAPVLATVAVSDKVATEVKTAAGLTSGSGTLIAAGAANMVAAGGGNMVAAGGGNMVAAGGGN